MCKECWKDILKNEENDDEIFHKIFGEDEDEDSLDYGSRNTAHNTEFGFTDREKQGMFDTQEQEDRYHHGMKCHYCDDDAEWKCINGLTDGCQYSGPSSDGIQVCGANGEYAAQNKEKHPNGHRDYALEVNSGHTFVAIDEYFRYDPDFGFQHGKHGGHR